MFAGAALGELTAYRRFALPFAGPPHSLPPNRQTGWAAITLAPRVLTPDVARKACGYSSAM
jgi:hypothetical protein